MSLLIDLDEGLNELRISATDQAGNKRNYIIGSLSVDSIAPELSELTPSEGAILRDLNFTIAASANEPLSEIKINGEVQTISAPVENFLFPQTKNAEGTYQYLVEVSDIAGNTNSYTVGYTIVLKSFISELIEVVPRNGRVYIVGQEGAVRNGVQVEVSTGLFDSQAIEIQENGNFEIEVAYSTNYDFKVFDPDFNTTEDFSLDFIVDTTLSGVIKDIYDNPLSGVTVTLSNSGQSTTTNSSGVFAIEDPQTGDQKLLIDGTTIPNLSDRSYSKINMIVSIGRLQKNILPRIIYLAPILKDGSETDINIGQDTVVSSVHAEGVSLEIKGNTALFPAGVEKKINMIEIPADKTSIEIPESSRPGTVYALEPSGLKFIEPAQLTLPNDNNFPEGTEMVIMSKNSTTGAWEPDGFATVVGNEVVTKEGQGIEHFSEVYATTYGLRVEEFSPDHRPGIYNDKGGMEKNISLPTYKTLGKDFGLSFKYNNLWAKPRAFVTNSFNLPRERVVKTLGEESKYNHVVYEGTIESWLRPVVLGSQFVSGNSKSQWHYFDLTSTPEHATFSYSTDMSTNETGVYPATSNYVLEYENLTIQSIEAKYRNERWSNNFVETKRIENEVLETLEAIFPPALKSNIYLQNRNDSEFGQGWKLQANLRLIHPENDKVLIEEASGALTPYILKNTVEDVQDVLPVTSSFFYDDTVGDMKIAVNEYSSPYHSKIFKTPLNNQQLNLVGTAGNINVNVGINQYQYASPELDGTHTSLCRFGTYSGKRFVHTKRIAGSGNEILFLDTESQIYKFSPELGVKHLSGLKDNRTYIEEINSIGGTLPTVHEHFIHNFNSHHVTYDPQLFVHGVVSVYSFETLVRGSESDPSTICHNNPYFNIPLQRGSNLPISGNTNGRLDQAGYNSPEDILYISPGEYLIADTGNNIVRKLNINTNQVEYFAGNLQTDDYGVDGYRSNHAIFHPTALEKDKFGNIYVASEKGYIRRISPDGQMKVISGRPVSEGGEFVSETIMEKMSYARPGGLSIDNDRGYLYVADTNNHRIVQIDLVDGNAKTVLGTNICVPGESLIGKVALNTSICSPKDIEVDKDGNLLYHDVRNSKIRKLIINHSAAGVQRYAAQDVNNKTELIRLADGSFERVYRSGSVDRFSKIGQHLESEDMIGYKTRFEYEGNLLTKIIDPVGKETLFTYFDGLLDNIKDPADRVTSFTYGVNNTLSRVVYPDGSMEDFDYDEYGNMVSSISKSGSETTYEYDELLQLKKVNLPDGSDREFASALSEVYSEENITPENKKELSNFAELSFADILKDGNGFESALLRGTSGEVDKIIDAKGRETTITRDHLGRTTKIQRFDETYMSLTYNDYGDLVQKYDSKSNYSMQYEYSEKGQLLKTTNSKGQTQTQVYDSNSIYLLEKLDHLGIKTSYTYNADGLVNTIKNHLDEETQFIYDSEGNLARKISPEGEETKYVRDLAGNIISKENSEGVLTLYDYDDFNRLISVATGVTGANPGGVVTSYEYYPSGSLKKITDPKGEVTSFVYDSMDRLVSKVNPLGLETILSYDGNGNVNYEKDPNGHEKSFEYDSDNQLIKKSLRDNIYNMAYDDHGNMISINDHDSDIEFSYELVGDDYVVSSTTVNNDTLPLMTLEYDYDQVGNREEMVTPFGTFNYQYDGVNRLTNIKNHKNENFSFFYDDAHRLTGMSREGGYTQYEFDQNNFLTQIKHSRNDTSVIDNVQYERDLIGNRTKKTASRGIASYTYDAESQLKTVSNSEVLGSDYQNESFNYDSLGNRLNDQLGSFVYDNNSQRLVEDYKHFYFYDNNGNMTSVQEKGITSNFKNLTYSTENQLLEIKEYKNNVHTKTISYFYDALGRRFKKAIVDHTNAANSFQRKYHYDGQEILAEYDENNTVLGVYTHSTLRTDDVLAVDVRSTKLASTTGSYMYLKDALGSITDITDASGTLIQHYAYSSFGKILKIVDNSGNDITANPLVKTGYGFTNREHDEESGLMYYRARYMMPEIGRFIQEDKHPGSYTSPVTVVNKYTYAGNNPILNVDPSGKFFVTGIILASLIGAVTASANGGNFFEGALVGAGAFTAGYLVGPLIASSLGLKGAGALVASMLFGGLAGGIVGGLGHKMLGFSNFNQGFGFGFGLGMTGGAAGYYDDYAKFNEQNLLASADMYLQSEDPYKCLFETLIQQGTIIFGSGNPNDSLIDVIGIGDGGTTRGQGCFRSGCSPGKAHFKCRSVSEPVYGG